MEWMVYTIIKIYSRATIFIKCQECGEWGNVVQNRSRFIVKHCDKKTNTKTTCSHQGNEFMKNLIREEHKKYTRRQLNAVQEEIRHGNRNVLHPNDKSWKNINNGKMPIVWKMGKSEYKSQKNSYST